MAISSNERVKNVPSNLILKVTLKKSGAGLWESWRSLRIVVEAQILYHPKLTGVDPCQEKLVSPLQNNIFLSGL